MEKIMNKEIKFLSGDGEYITLSYFQDTELFFLEIGESKDDQDSRVFGFDREEVQEFINDLEKMVRETKLDK
jgi:hypothetical protein